MSLKPRFGFVLEYVTDIEAAKHFYIYVLGLEMELHHPTFVQFGTFAIVSDDSMTGNRDPELYWLVDDAEAAFRDLSQKTKVDAPLMEMPSGKVFSIKEPEGRSRYLLELARDRLSRQV
jgi:catechol 2,3-dioxygenase-like lactoylglutathione lyase family enzyme